MSYRLSKKELRIIERTKDEGNGPDDNPIGKRNTKWTEILKPYLFFILIFIGIALAVSMLVILTGR